MLGKGSSVSDLTVSFHDLGTVDDQLLAFAVIGARHQGRWVFVRHRQRHTWEIPGGHREAGETILQAAERELREETGVLSFELMPVCEYSVSRGGQVSFGRLFLAEIHELGSILDMEIGQVELYDDLPEELTYPQIQPVLHRRLREFVSTAR